MKIPISDKSVRRSSSSTFGRSIGNYISGHYFFNFFPVFYHKRSAQIKKKYLEKADWSAQKLRVDFDGGAGFERVC